MIFDVMLCLTAFVCLAIAWSDHVHTGILGSIGLVAIACSMFIAVDDSYLSSVARIEGVIVGICTGVLMVAGQLLIRVSRTARPKNKHRRATDWGDLDEVKS
jgi:hypothetical protein